MLHDSKKHTGFSSFPTFRKTPSGISSTPIRKNSRFSDRYNPGFVPGCISLMSYDDALETMNSREDVL
jgi:hypothetical protein